MLGDDPHSLGISTNDGKTYFKRREIKTQKPLNKRVSSHDIIGIVICLDGLAKELLRNNAFSANDEDEEVREIIM